MKSAQKNVKVVLDGQGADELFAGYIPYYADYIADLMDKKYILGEMQSDKNSYDCKKNGRILSILSARIQ